MEIAYLVDLFKFIMSFWFALETQAVPSKQVYSWHPATYVYVPAQAFGWGGDIYYWHILTPQELEGGKKLLQYQQSENW